MVVYTIIDKAISKIMHVVVATILELKNHMHEAVKLSLWIDCIFSITFTSSPIHTNAHLQLSLSQKHAMQVSINIHAPTASAGYCMSSTLSSFFESAEGKVCMNSTCIERTSSDANF